MSEQQQRQPGTPGQQPVVGRQSFDPVEFLRKRGLIGAGAPVQSTGLKGGYLNQVYRMTGPFGDWVVKCFRNSSELTLFPNSGDMEARALDELGPKQIAPQLIGYFPDTPMGDVLVYDYYDGQSWPGGKIPPDVVGVAELLHRLHALPVEGFREVPVLPQAILEQGDAFLGTLVDDPEGLDALRPEPIEMLPLPRRCLLHTDTGPGNLILGKAGLRLIDWQCPALGDPAEDLCAFLSPAFQILYGCPPLSVGQRDTFLKAYGDNCTIERLHRLEPFLHWRMAAYCAMRRHQYREARPAASSAYDQALNALIDLLQQQ